MLRCALTTLCFLFCVSASIAQSFVKGKVSDKVTKETIPGAIVASGNKTASTSLDGDYSLEVPVGKQTILVSMLGYKTWKKEIETKEGDTLSLNIQLETSNKILDEVVISAGKYEQKLSDVTVSMEVIKPDLLQNKCIAQLDQVMNQIPSVYITDSQISIRGGSGYSYGAGSRVLMLVDEMPMISADAGDIKWNYIPIENMEQMEIIKGASSALYGSSALNGVINLRTKYARDKPETQITTYTGVYGNPSNQNWAWWKKENKSNPSYQATTFSHAQKFGQLDVVMGGQVYNDEGYRKDSDERRLRANANLRYNFKDLPGLSIGVNGTIMRTVGGLFFLWKKDSTAYVPRDSTNQHYNNVRYNVDPYITYVSEKMGKLCMRTRTFYVNNDNDKSQGAISFLLYRELQWSKRFDKLTISAGAVNMITRVRPNAVYGGHNGTNLAGYLQADRKFFGRLMVSAGARVEYFKVDTAQTRGGFFLLNDVKKTNVPVQPVFRAGVNYQAFDQTFIRASFGQGYRFPSVAEKYISTSVGGSLNIFPNKNLQPERGWSAEIGIKQGFRIAGFQGFADAAVFTTEYFNMMDFVFKYDTVGKSNEIWNADNPLAALASHAGFQSQNVGRAIVSGVDVSLTGTGNIGPVRIDLLGGFTYTNPINPDYNPNTDTLGSLKTSLLRYRNKVLYKNDIQLTWKGFAVGWSTRFSSYMANIDKRFEEPLIYERMNPNTSLYYLDDFYILPGLKRYRESHNKGDWMNDFRMSYQLNNHLKLSFLINNILNHEFMSRPGYLEPPRTFIFQASIKF